MDKKKKRKADLAREFYYMEKAARKTLENRAYLPVREWTSGIIEGQPVDLALMTFEDMMDLLPIALGNWISLCNFMGAFRNLMDNVEEADMHYVGLLTLAGLILVNEQIDAFMVKFNEVKERKNQS